MKKLSIILACILVAMISCTKSKEVHPENGDGDDEIVTVGMKDVHVEYTRTDHAELNRVVFHYCPADINGNAQQFMAAEMTKKETFFELTLNDLLSDTLYWYYYELFPNNGDTFNTAQKTFHTQAYDTPEPPTPPTPSTPEGAINGLFTINENGDQVYFSKGNLQYQASTNTWRFAEHQWDYVGNDTFGIVYEDGVKCNNELISSTYNGWVDLFGWGTSGYDHGAVCYQPFSSSQQESDYFVYGQEGYNLCDQTGKADWGYNAISNGGSSINKWRTLSKNEWYYFLNSLVSTNRFAKAKIGTVCGLILLPDNWDMDLFNLNNTNDPSAGFSSNVIEIDNWNVLENAGAVFLPCAGCRYGLDTDIVGIVGEYYSSWIDTTAQDHPRVYNIHFESGDFYLGSQLRWVGQSVRLVQDANK